MRADEVIDCVPKVFAPMMFGTCENELGQECGYLIFVLGEDMFSPAFMLSIEALKAMQDSVAELQKHVNFSAPMRKAPASEEMKFPNAQGTDTTQ